MIDPQRLLNWPFPEIEHAYDERDCILYALGLGIGLDPLDPLQLRFVYEHGLQAMPSMASVLTYPGNWHRDPATGIDQLGLLHGEQGLLLHRPLPTAGRLAARTRVTAIVDKGAGKPALLYFQRDARDVTTNAPMFTVTGCFVMRGQGGFGGSLAAPQLPPEPLPDRPPDATCDLPTSPQAALIYRLSGDRNPLHVDTAVAQGYGFPRPILHGLCTYGIACHAIIRLTGNAPARVRRFDARLSAPVYPGDTIRTELWREHLGAIGFRCRAVERHVIVLDRGVAELNPES